MSESHSGGGATGIDSGSSDKEFSCPSCEDVFSTQQGMRIHHARTHGESLRLVTVKCANCGEEREKEPHHVENTDRHYCSKGCQAEYLRQEVESECKLCGSVETYSPPSTERVFCSDDCRFEYFSGETHPQHKPNGKYHPGPNWEEQAEKARHRDDYRCQSCGKHESNEDKKLHVHHITPRSEFVDQRGVFDYKDANKVSNLVSLCNSCHPKWEGVPVKPELI